MIEVTPARLSGLVNSPIVPRTPSLIACHKYDRDAAGRKVPSHLWPGLTVAQVDIDEA